MKNLINPMIFSWLILILPIEFLCGWWFTGVYSSVSSDSQVFICRSLKLFLNVTIICKVKKFFISPAASRILLTGDKSLLGGWNVLWMKYSSETLKKKHAQLITKLSHKLPLWPWTSHLCFAVSMKLKQCFLSWNGCWEIYV